MEQPAGAAIEKLRAIAFSLARTLSPRIIGFWMIRAFFLLKWMLNRK